MGFFDKIKEFQNQISQVENSIYNNKQDFLEIYERNIHLEKEIAERSKELDVTNQRMLTLQHIWEMMNSSTPLSSVFSLIVKSLPADLGYLHSAILKLKEDEDGKYLKVIAHSENPIVEKINSALGKPIDTTRLTFVENGLFAKSIEEKSIKQTVDLRKVLTLLLPDISEDTVRNMLANAQTRSLIIIPLITMDNDFGWLVAFSTREVAEEAEINFLRLFSHQIELAITIADLFQQVKNQALTDPLTGLFNRRYFEEFLNKEVIRAQRTEQPFTLITLDLDYLKQINDKYGHSFGDLAIKTIADVLKKNARSIDVAARMGGEEFDILLPGVDSKGGLIAAERIRSAIAECKLDTIGQITASLGVATFPEHSSNVDELLELVDQAMYAAKRNGRNQIQLAKSITEISWQEVAMDAFEEILAKHKIPISKDFSETLHKQISKSNVKEKTKPKDMLYSVADMLAKMYNPRHVKGVTKSKVQFANKLAKVFDLSEEEIDKLRIAMLLYDIGNLMISQEVLQKAEPLTEEEKAEIKKHPVIAAKDILKPITEVQNIIPIIEHHHENWDGTGYPGKVAGEEIPISSQIILIVDAYFALIEPRSYRDALSPTEALEVIKNDADKKWNPTLVKEFISFVENSIKL